TGSASRTPRRSPSSRQARRACRRAESGAWSALLSPSGSLARGCEGAIEYLPIRVEREETPRFVRGDPAHLVVFVIVRGRVDARRLHQEEVHELKHAHARRREPVMAHTDVATARDL